MCKTKDIILSGLEQCSSQLLERKKNYAINKMKIEHQQTCDKTEREAANLGLFSRSKSGREPEYNGFSTAGRLPLPAPWPALQTQRE